MLTDGGLFDNLGKSCLEPGRSEQHSYNVFPVDYIAPATPAAAFSTNGGFERDARR